MPSSHLPPEERAKVKLFNPLVLDRTVIAGPLLKDMEEDLRLIAHMKKLHPEEARASNATVEFNKDFHGGIESARKRVEEMILVATRETLATAARRVARAGKEAKASEEQRHRALEQAIQKPVIGSIQTEDQKTHYSFATLHAAVIRRLLAANERFALAEMPIARIYPRRFEIILDLNLEYPGGREAARQWVFDHIEEAKKRGDVRDPGQQLHLEKDRPDSQYLFARMEALAIQKLVDLDMADAQVLAEKRRSKTKNASERERIDPTRFRAIFHIWPDFEISACINKSIATVKADAAQNSFSARGAGITWAVMDSGIDNTHPHFTTHANLVVPQHWHKDFTIDGGGPFDDKNGHGTHVAGIIAGEWRVAPDAPRRVARPVAVSRYLKTDSDDVEYQQTRLDGISGMAPRCKLVSLRVLDENGKGAVSNLIAAIGHVQEINGYGRRLLIHGVNLSVGYNFEPEWFACGQSPLCVEVDRLVKTGVVVVVAAGNTGYGTLESSEGGTSAGMALTINDPGNADLAITVGSTHRDMPHIYGVSYFSSKGPTGDGRLKPDLVAPGEKIISCATGDLKRKGAKGVSNLNSVNYVETSGTSMAAPHVSGVIAAFLSVRTEFIGQSDRIKQIFTSTATDLRRDRYFQGAGLVDLMRAIQSV
jgi:hypothetical protein